LRRRKLTKAKQVLEGVHHINFLVADLGLAIERYKEFFGVESMQIESLPQRGVRTARFNLNGVWIVLVQPVNDDCEPMRHLRQHGEGLYLVSFAVENLDAAIEDLAAKGAIDKSAKTREGLQGWRVIDLEPDAVFGALIQLTQDKQ
jgi:methylmalonyl-CoA/ethylmalonyl-CoA epimerase